MMNENNASIKLYAQHVGRFTDLGAIFPETAKKMLAACWHPVGAAYGTGIGSESIAMMIYYHLCTGSSLRSQ